MRRGVPLHSAQRFLEPYLGIGYRLHYFNRSAIISSIQRNVFLGRDKDKKFRRVFEICFTLLSALECEHPELLESYLDAMSKEHIHTQVTLRVIGHPGWTAKKQGGSPREKFMHLMRYYATLFEESYRCICSVYVLAKSTFNGVPPPTEITAFLQDKVTKYTKSLRDDSGDTVPTLPELCEGCNAHLRNSINHGRWKMLKRNNIQAWDINPNTNKVNWIRQYDEKELRDEVESLRRTIDAMDLAVLVKLNEMCNQLKGIAAISPGFYDDEVVESFIEDVTMEFGLFADSFSYDEASDTFTINLYVPLNLDTPQETEIYEGFEDGTPPNVFKMKKYVHEAIVSHSVLNSLLVMGRCLHQYSSVILNPTADTSTWTGDEWIAHETDLGTYRFTRAELEEFSKGNHAAVESALAPLANHTLKITTSGPSVPVFP